MEKYKLDYEKYKNRFKELYPWLSEEEREKIFYLRIEFWEIMIENICNIDYEY